MRSAQKARVVQCNSCRKPRLDMDSVIHTIQSQPLMPQPDISTIYYADLMEGLISLLPPITQVKAQLRLSETDVSFGCRTAKLSMVQGRLQAEFLRTARRRIMCAWRSTYFVAES